LLVPSGGLLVWGGMHFGTLSRGFGWDGWWMAPVRLAFPFIAGLVIYRLIDRLPVWRWGLVPLGLGLVVVFALPVVGSIGHRDAAGLVVGAGAQGAANGLFEALMVMLVFPAIVWLGAHSAGPPWRNHLCSWLGRLSYPLYIIHYPFVYLLWDLAVLGHPSALALHRALVWTFPAMLALATAVMLVYDEPVRRWLSRRTRA